jgi:hypothetical protein
MAMMMLFPREYYKENERERERESSRRCTSYQQGEGCSFLHLEKRGI